ncbi:hypothetical protein Hanom_Chr04g00338851 [Helianthus anomalus]
MVSLMKFFTAAASFVAFRRYCSTATTPTTLAEVVIVHEDNQRLDRGGWFFQQAS